MAVFITINVYQVFITMLVSVALALSVNNKQQF
jgi:hypothetical protein